MAKPKIEPPPSAQEIIKRLEKVTATGNSRSRIFEDWLTLVEATLEAMPAHAKSMLERGEPAEDPPEVKAAWEKIAAKYPAWAFECFTQAFAVLCNGASEFQDLVGQVYMSWGWPNDYLGQFFTPWHVARFMAMMTVGESGPKEVLERLESAIAASPVATALTLAGLTVPDDVKLKRAWFFEKIIPAALAAGKFKPVTVFDPCVGSGVMLLAAASCYPHWMIDLGLVQFYGVDIDRLCVQMCRINVMLYGLNGFHLKCALAMSQAEVEALPVSEPVKSLIEEARASGDEDTAREVGARLRSMQLPMFVGEAAANV